MLTANLIRPRLRFSGNHLTVQMLPIDNKRWQQTTTEVIALFESMIGRTVGEWETALETYEGDRLDYVVIRGLAKVLLDAAAIGMRDTPIHPAALRERVYAHSPAFEISDLFHTQSRQDILNSIAAELETTLQKIEETLFADLAGEMLILESRGDWTPEGLITRYNLELARGVLYWSNRLEVDIYGDYKDFWRYLKLFKLMFWAEPHPDDAGYHVVLDGPISPFVSTTTRYGRQFAAFLPALLLGKMWKMRASVKPPQADDWLVYELDHTSLLTSHFKRSGMFDSRLEADFAAEFAEKFGDERGKWVLTREDEVLLLGDTVMIPDFAVTHKQDGRRALIEIMGFWHPDYLRRKLEKVRTAHIAHLILLVYEGVNLAAEALQDVPAEVLYFKNKPVLKEVMAAVERVAQ